MTAAKPGASSNSSRLRRSGSAAGGAVQVLTITPCRRAERSRPSASMWNQWLGVFHRRAEQRGRHRAREPGLQYTFMGFRGDCADRADADGRRTHLQRAVPADVDDTGGAARGARQPAWPGASTRAGTNSWRRWASSRYGYKSGFRCAPRNKDAGLRSTACASPSRRRRYRGAAGSQGRDQTAER